MKQLLMPGLFAFLIIGPMGCAATNLLPVRSANGPFVLEKDEKELWDSAKEIENSLAKAGLTYEDSDLEAYLNSVAQGLAHGNLSAEAPRPRVRVLRDPFLNALALPNGSIFVHTGMLARMENEAQLATVLAHEIVHFIHRHALREVRSAKNQMAAMQVMQFLITGAAVVAGAYAAAYSGTTQLGELVMQVTGQLGQHGVALWSLASISGYSKELESEADEKGLEMMIQAGYDPKESLRIFELFKEERDVLKIKEPFFFGTHPRLDERMESGRRFLDARSELSTQEDTGKKNSEEFLSRIHRLLVDNANLDLQIGRFKTAEAAVEKHLRRAPRSARGHFLAGEIHRRAGREEEAIAAYRTATLLDPAQSDPHRELGLIYRSRGDVKEARAALEKYLSLSTKALDAPVIRGYLDGLSRPDKEMTP